MQRNKNWSRLVITVIIISFLYQNIVLAAPTLQNNTLSPAFQLSRTEFAESYFFSKVKMWNRETQLDIPRLFHLLKKNTDNIRKDLDVSDINVLQYDNRIELISPYYTLVFLDSTHATGKWYCHKIPGTNISMYLQRHSHLLKDAPQKPKLFIKSQERAVITDRDIHGINTIPMPQNQRIAVIELTQESYIHYAGNFIGKLQENNEIRVFTFDSLSDLKQQISSFHPDIIILPENIPGLDKMIEGSPFEYTLIYYENGFSENAYFYIPEEDMQIAKEAITEYKSQIERTPYHEIAELFALYTGRKTNRPYAHPFIVTEIRNGELEDIDSTLRYALDIDTDIPLVTISPHIDDMAIAIPGLVRDKLKRTSSGSIGVIDLVFAYSERGVSGEGTIEEKRAIRIDEDRNAKNVLAEGTSGRIETQYFGFDLKDEAQYEQQVQHIVNYFRTITKGFTVALPHPEDSHPTHRKTTQIAIEALKRISKERNIKINVLYYKTPWSDNYNTFYISKEDSSGNEVTKLGKQAFTRTVGELAGADFAVKSQSPEELGGEFTERFRRSVHVPKKYIDGVDNQRLETALSKERLVQSHSGIRIKYNPTTGEDRIIAGFYAYNYLRFIYNDITRTQGKPPEKISFVIGHDPRPTAVALLETQIRGFLAAAKKLGVELEIINLGIIPKPMYQNAVRSFQAHGGVYLTASHNDLNWNGLEYATKYKVERGFTFGGSLLNASESRELIRSFSESIRRLMAGDLSIIGEINNTWPVIEIDKHRYEVAKSNYKRFVSEKFGSVSDVKIVLDPNGGASCGIYKEILEELGFIVIEINSEIGKPAHKIDPEKDPACYTELAKIIKREGALFGMTFDYDGDRAYLTILDFQGNLRKVSPQDTAAINVTTVLKWCRQNNKLTPKTAIVVNDPTSGRIIEIAKQFDVEVFYVEVGETNLVNKMHELRQQGYYVPIAVEGSNGGTIFFDSMCRDGLLSTISVALGETIRDLREPIPQYYTESDEICDLDISIKYSAARLRSILLREELLAKQHLCVLALATPCVDALSSPPHKEGRGYSRAVIKDLKMRIERFIMEYPTEFSDYEVHYFEGTNHIINRSKIPGRGMIDETGGWKLVLKTLDGEEHFIWLRPSKTEPNIIRIEYDSPVKEMIPRLKKLFLRATMEKRYTVSSDLDEMSRKAAEYFVNEVNRLIERKGRAVICFATGDTPREMYKIIREEYRNAVDWSKVIAFHLDEYVFSPEEYPLRGCRYSYRYFLQEEIFNYLPVPEENIHFLNETDPFDEKYYRDQFMEEVERAGGIDLCILGIGKNGHIAFDEPGSSFDSTIRKVKLKFSTRWTNRKAFGQWWQFWSVFKVPRYAFTLGIQEIMASRKIILLASGRDKTEAVQKSLFGPIIEEVPASILQRHPDVRYFLDKKAFGFNEDADEVEELGYRIFGHMYKPNFIKKLFNINWWRDKAMYMGMRFRPIKKWLMKKINEYPGMPIYKKILFSWFGLGMRFIAPRFIAGDTVKKVTENIMRLRDKKIDYTVDILGEAVTDEEEAEENKNRYIRLLEELTDFTGTVNPVRSRTRPDLYRDATSNGVNLSLKLTGLVSKLDQKHKEIAKRRLREILRRAIELDAFITIDMEQYCYKDLTLKIYKEILEEPEFEKCDNLQIVLQVYLRDSPRDIEEFIKWARLRYERTGAKASVRLVKGAYWDKEAQWAKEEGRPSPVWSEKWQTDKNYEDMTALLLQNYQYIQTVFATHNVRSIARVIYEAQKNKIPKDEIEFQMLYGMGEQFQDALVKMGYRVRAYVPYGPLLKGLKYFARRIEENTSQESFLLQSLSGRYQPSELLKQPGPSMSDSKKRFAQALGKLLKLSPKDFIPDTIKDKLKEFNGGKKPRYYSFNSIDRLRRFCRWGYLWRLIRPDEVIVVRLILPEKYGKRLFIAALRFGDLKEEILKETENVNIVEWGKTYFLINRNFNSNDCVIKDEGIYIDKELRGKGLGSSTFRLFIQRISESGFGGYPYRVQIEDPKLLHLAYEELDGRINTTNTGLTQIFVQKFEEETGKRYTGNPREFLGYLAGLYRQGRDIDWKVLRMPVEGTIPGIAEPRTPKERFEEMLSSSEMLKKYIEDGRIFELIPEWKDWVKLYDNPNFRDYHHLPPEEHLVLAFSRLESDYFRKIIEEYKLRGAGVAHVRRALFLHDFGKIVALQRDPGYAYASHIAHPEYSAEMAKRILLNLGYSPEEITDDILLVRHHEVLKNLAQEGGSEISPLEFVNLLNHPWNLRLLHVLQLVDAASVRHSFENSLSIGLERRVNEIANFVGAILITRGEQRANQEKRLLDYLTDIKRQNNEIGLAFDRFKEALARHGIEIDKDKLKEAFQAMNRSHLGLLRKDDRTPFAIHPIETATILVDELGVRNPNWIIASLLHDVLEDTRTTVGVIELIFGKEVASIVRLLSKPDITRYTSKYEQEIDFYHRIIYGADEIIDRNILTAAQTIKIADRINNLRTLNFEIAGKQINETYEVFIHYFIGETEVSVDIKRALIRELIRQGKEWKVLTPEQIQELETLSREIIEFKIPKLRIEASSYNFIRGLVEYRQQEKPGTPLVLAFNGMSGVGRTTFAAHLQEQLQRVGKKVVVFDANDYLLPRSERDKALQRAKEEGVVFYEQRKKLYDIDRFRKEVWDRLKGFKESSSPTLRFKLSGLYNRLTGQLDAPNKLYEIDRDTVILIEGIHIFQEDLLPLYDATFLVDAPREVCLENVLQREKEKPPEYRQPSELIRERFELVDWPSYRKHLLEYWRASGFIIDNTDYRKPLVKKNPFPRYPEKTHDVPKELTDPQERLNRNLENIFRQLIDKGISPYDIIPNAKNHIDIFRNLLAVKGINQLIPKGISIPSLRESIDALDYFLDQLTTQTDIVDIFFNLFESYILEKFGQGAKIPPVICGSSFPQDLLLRILSKRNWGEVKFIPNFILYRSNGLYIEVPRVGRIAIGDQERQFVYRHFALRFIYDLLNRYNHIGLVRGLRGLLKWILHYFKPQRIISGEYMNGYRLILERAPHLITPTRIVEDNNLREKIRLKGMARQNKALILQLSEGRLLIDYIRELINRNAWDEVEKTLEKAFNFLEELLQYGLADLDPEVNIWENLVVTENGKIKACDAESITDNLDEVKDHCESIIKDALFLLNLVNHRGISGALKLLEADTEKPNCLIKTLINHFGEQNAERLLKIFLRILVKRFDSIRTEEPPKFTGRIDKPLSCKFPGEEDLKMDEKLAIEGFIKARKEKGPKYYEVLGPVMGQLLVKNAANTSLRGAKRRSTRQCCFANNSDGIASSVVSLLPRNDNLPQPITEGLLGPRELSRHRVFKNVLKILADHAPASHEPIKKALVEGEVVSINTSNSYYRRYNDKQVHVRICIVQSDKMARVLFPRAEPSLGIPIYPTFTEEDDKTFLDLNILSTFLDQSTVTPEVLVGLIVHELSELLLNKSHPEAVLEERHYTRNKIPSRLQWMIDEYGRKSLVKKWDAVKLLKQLIEPYRLAAAYFGLPVSTRIKIIELSKLVSQRAQMWLDFYSLIRKMERKEPLEINNETKEKLIQNIKDYKDIKELDTCGVIILGSNGRFEFTIGNKHYVCSTFGQGNESVIVGLVLHEKFGLCLWRFSPSRGTFKVYSLKPVMGNLSSPSEEEQDFRLESLGEDEYIENVFKIREEQETAPPADEIGEKECPPKKVVDPEVEAAFSRMGGLITRYGEFLRKGVTLPFTEETPDIEALRMETESIQPFTFETTTKRRRIALIANNRLIINIPKEISDKANIGLYWDSNWGLLIWISNLEENNFVVYRADICLNCWDAEKKDSDFYATQIALGATLDKALGKARKWMTRWSKEEEEKAREEAKAIIKYYAETVRGKRDISELKDRISKFQGAKFEALKNRDLTITPHTKNHIEFQRLGKRGELFKMRFILHKYKGMLAVFVCEARKRRTVVYSLDQYVEGYDENTQERKRFMLQPIGEGEYYKDVMNKVMISEEELYKRLNKVLAKLGFSSLANFISSLGEADLALLSAIRIQLPTLDEILQEAESLGAENEFYISLKALVENLKTVTSPSEIWRRQFEVSQGALKLKPGAIIRFDVAEGKSMSFPDIDHAISGPATIEFILKEPIQLKDLNNRALKISLEFKNGTETVQKVFLAYIARNSLYILDPDGRRFTLSELENPDTAGGIIEDIMPKSYTGKGGSDKEAHPSIIPSFENGTALDISSKPITIEAKDVLLSDERFNAKDKEFVERALDKKGFSQIRVVTVPDLPFDGHYGMGGEVNQHLVPTVYVPEKLYEYLLERHNKGDPLAKTELADYLYHKYVESRLAYLYSFESDQAHQIVEHSNYEKEKNYLAPVTFNELKNARSRLMKWIARNLIKVKITELLTKRQQDEYRKDAKFRKELEAEIETQIQQLHELVILSEAAKLGEIADEIKKMSLTDLNLTKLYKHLREISALDILDAIEKCAIGRTSTHIALLPEVLEKLAHGELDFFKERFVEPNPETEAYLLQMKELFEELAKDKEMLIAFILGFVLHDYGLLLMRRGENSHAVDGERLLERFLDKLPLSKLQKDMIKVLVGEHVQLYLMLKGDITSEEYECSLEKLMRLGINREKAIKMSILFLFLDTCSADSEWLKRAKWLNNKYVKRLLSLIQQKESGPLATNSAITIFIEKVGALIAAQKDLINLEKPERQQQTRQDIAEILKRFITDPAQDKLTQSMAWHVLEGISMDEGFKGKVIYSLNALLQSRLNDGKGLDRIKRLVAHTKGRVFFYAGDDNIIDPDYSFIKESLVTKHTMTAKITDGELLILMLNNGDIDNLGLDRLNIGKLVGNQFLVPVGEDRDVGNDIFLGLELIRNNGNLKDLPSLFKLLLIEAIKEWLLENNEPPTPQKIREILRIEIPDSGFEFQVDIDCIKDIITSA